MLPNSDTNPDYSGTAHGTVLNVLWVFYILFFSEQVLQLSHLAVSENQPAYGLAIILLLTMVAETIALPKKLRNTYVKLNQLIPDGVPQDNSTLPFLFWILHTLVSLVIVLFALNMCGHDLQNDKYMYIYLPLIFGVVIKELVLLFYFFDFTNPKQKDKLPKINRFADILYDLILFVFSCLAYTVTWQNIAYNMAGKSETNSVLLLVNLFASSVIFLMFYLPLRTPYILESIYNPKPQPRVWFLVTLFLTVAAMWYEMFL